MTRSVGIDIGSRSIKIAELSFMGKEVHLLGLYEIALEANDSIEAKLLQFFGSFVVKPERLSVGLGPIPILFKRINLPFQDRNKVELAIRNDFEDTLPFSLDNYLLEFQMLGKNGRSKIFQAALCHQEHIDKLNSHIAAVSQISPNHFLLDNEALARLALWQKSLTETEEAQNYCVCDIGYNSTKIALIKQKHHDKSQSKWKDFAQNILEYRTLNKGFKELYEWMQSHKKISHNDLEQWLRHRAQILSEGSETSDSLIAQTSDEIKTALKPLLVEIYQTIQSFKSKQGLSTQKLLITGALTQVKGFDNFLSTELRLPVENWNIFDGIQATPNMISSEKNSQFALALALAFRYSPQISIPSLNFRRSSLANKKLLTHFLTEIFRPENKRFWIGAAATFVFLMTYNFFNSYFANQEKTLVKKQLIEELRLTDPLLGKRALNFYHDPERTREIFEQEKGKLLKNYTQNSEAKLNLLLSLSKNLPQGVTVEDMEMREASGGSTSVKLQMLIPYTGKASERENFQAQLKKIMDAQGFQTTKFQNLRANTLVWEAQKKGVNL
jgi:Tfp pilus assembly PilM family ATPase